MNKRIPVTVLTGFLGSGKTTALNRLLKLPELRNTAVIINEFGEVGLDHHLISTSEENLVLLANGCICCTVRGDLVDTFAALTQRHNEGGGTIDRVIVETTGLADPAPILHTLMNEAAVASHYRLQNVIATVDAVNATSTLDQHAEAVKQVAVADRLLLTKADLTQSATLDALVERLRAINPAAPIVDVTLALSDASILLEGDDYDPATRTQDVREWLRLEAYDAQPDHHHHGHGDAAHVHHHDRNRHDDHIQAYSITREHPVTWAGLQAWLDMLAAMRGDDLLRVKGIVNVVEHPGRPVVIHGVQHIFHPHEFLPRWPDGDERTRIVFITRDIERDVIDETLRIFENKRPRRPRPGAEPQ